MVAYLMNRWLPEHHHHPPLSSPVSRHSHRLNFYLGIVLAVFMAVSVVALVCCCYHLEWRLRLQARNAARRVSRGSAVLQGSHEMITRAGKKIKQGFGAGRSETVMEHNFLHPTKVGPSNHGDLRLFENSREDTDYGCGPSFRPLVSFQLQCTMHVVMKVKGRKLKCYG